MDKDKDEAAKDKADEKRDKDKAARDPVLIVTSTANGPADWKSDGDDLGIEDGNVVFGKPVSRLHLNNLKRSHDVLAAAHDVAERKDRIVKARLEVENLQLEVFNKTCELHTAEKLLAACKADEQNASIDLLQRADAWSKIV